MSPMVRSQQLTRQKGLRVEQVLMILNVIDVEPEDFFGELYGWTAPFRGGPPPPAAVEVPDELRHEFRELGAVLHRLVNLLLEQGLVTERELSAAVAVESGTR